VILDAWTFSQEAFDGVGLHWDIGTFNPDADVPQQGMMAYWFSETPVLSDASYNRAQIDYSQNNAAPNSFSSVAITYAGGSSVYPWQVNLASFTPLKLVVSQNGHSAGAPIGGTAGRAALYVMIVKPRKA